MKKPKPPHALPQHILAGMLRQIQQILWQDGENWDPDKEWDSGTIELVAEVLINRGLRPPEEA